MEIDEQIAVVDYCEWNRIPIYHIPNEGKRSRMGGGLLKRAGLKAGVPDLCIPVARGQFHGLYIEMKAKGGTLSAGQKDWLRLLLANGYAASACWSADRAIEIIKWYMKEGDYRDGRNQADEERTV